MFTVFWRLLRLLARSPLKVCWDAGTVFRKRDTTLIFEHSDIPAVCFHCRYTWSWNWCTVQRLGLVKGLRKLR